MYFYLIFIKHEFVILFQDYFVSKFNARIEDLTKFGLNFVWFDILFGHNAA